MILAAGDSFTYGDELQDRQRAWPRLLAELLDTDVVNLAESGASNDAMLRLVVEHTVNQTWDLVVVGWTNPERFEVWSELTQHPVTVMHNSLAGLPWTDDYYRYSYNAEYSYGRWFQQVLLLQQYLTSRQQPYLFVNVAGLWDEHVQHVAITQHIDATRYPGWPCQGMLEWTQDQARGANGHPLEAGHEQIAQKIYEYTRH